MRASVTTKEEIPDTTVRISKKETKRTLSENTVAIKNIHKEFDAAQQNPLSPTSNNEYSTDMKFKQRCTNESTLNEFKRI